MNRMDYSSMVELAGYRAAASPEKTLYRFLKEENKKEEILTFQGLDKNARKIAGLLQTKGEKGERIVIFCNPGTDYISSFFGCLYAGMIAVPAYPPKFKRNYHKILRMFQSCGAKRVLASSSILAAIRKDIEKDPFFGSIEWIDVENIKEDLADGWQNPNAKWDDLAFLQYTSGSTSDPKGVMVSHGNLLSNLRVIYNKFGESETSQGVIWLPPYHDMGLIGGILEPLYGGFETVLMSPFAFVQNPYIWLEAVSKYHATTSGGPNFAYELCLDRITQEQKAELDLSSWKVAFNGAEPVRQTTIERFSEAFRDCGFRKEAFYTCYGLAEATLFVTGVEKNEVPGVCCADKAALEENTVKEALQGEGKQFVSNGTVFEGEELCIVDPASLKKCPAGSIGEVWVKSECVAKGYWNQEELSRHTFHAFTEEDGPYLRTGDLGFVQNHELFIAGRHKDLIIIRGRNFYPQDIELAVEQCHEAFVANSGVAFSVNASEQEEERLVIVYEIKKNFKNADFHKIYHNVKKTLLEQFDLQPDALVLVRQMSLPKTSSGKVQRNLCREKYQNRELMLIGEIGKECGQDTKQKEEEGSRELAATVLKACKDGGEPSLPAVMAYLKSLACGILKIDTLTMDEGLPLNEYGFDSLMAVAFVHRIEEELKVTVPLERLLGGSSLLLLGQEVCSKLTGQGEPAEEDDDTGEEDGTKYIPLSNNQQSIFFMENLLKENGVYNLSYTVKFQKEPDTGLLRRAFGELVKFNPSLRTTFTFFENKPVQTIHEAMEPDFRETDVSGMDEAAYEETVKKEALRSFDLEQGPLLRVVIYQKKDFSRHMQITLHHLVTDFWSITVLVKELDLIYGQLINGRKDYEAELAGKPDYVRFVRRQKKTLDKKPELLAYWKEKLQGELPVLNLNTDYKRQAVQTYRGASEFLQFDSVFTEKVKEFCSQNGVTIYQFFLSSFALLLHKYTGQEDMVIGSLTSGRNRAEFAQVCGYFVNPVAMRADLSGNPRYEEYLKKIQKTTLEAFENQEYPFDLLVEQLKVPRGLSRTPVFQAMLVYQNSADARLKGLNAFALNETEEELELGELSLKLEPLHTSRVQYDITLLAAELKDGIGAALQYNTDLFAPDTAQNMLKAFRVLTENILDNPKGRFSELSALNDEQEDILLRQKNQTAMEYERLCLHRLVEKQARLTPERVAVYFEGQSMTYGELDKRANRLAGYLLRKGLEKEGPVALCLERSFEMTVGLLGILKAGGYYIPLDPTHPGERLQFIVEDATQGEVQPIVLTQSKLAGIFDSCKGVKICVDEEAGMIEKEEDSAPKTEVEAEQIAYTIYTSGSTGKPKGVQIPHKAAVNFMVSMKKEPGMTEDDVLLAVTTISFDIAGLEMFLPLSCGAAVVLAGERMNLDGKKLIGLIEEYGVTVMQGTPAIWRILLEAGWTGTKNLKILCGGEAFPPELAAKLLTHSKEVWNMYGPTETTIWSTVYLIEQEENPIPIGHPIGNTAVYILDSYLNPVPEGASGELYIGGDGLARGYYNRDELTAERFIRNPFEKEKGARMYRTGDLVRYRKDGNIEYLGRLDHQVKVRGFRIETGEIETVLNGHPQIQTSLVVAKENKAGINQLIAYLISEDKAGFNVSELRRFLKETLPDYMIPEHFVTMEAFPQTPNGKIDRKVLPDPEYTRPEMENEYIRPRSETEKQIARIWGEVLGMEQIGIQDNFFELGGNSMLMVQVQRRLSEEFEGRDIGIVELFQYPTVAAFASYLDGGACGDIREDNRVEEHVEIRKEKAGEQQSRREQRRKSRQR